MRLPPPKQPRPKQDGYLGAGPRRALGANPDDPRSPGFLARTLAKFGFVAPSLSSVALTRGAGAASFTRATIATVVDHEGCIKVCKSGEVRFPGARRVENLIVTTSEDFSSAAWALSSGGTGTVPTKTPNYGIAPDGTQTACRVQLDKGAGTTTADVSELYNNGAGTLRSVYIRSTDGVSTYQVVLATGKTVTVTGEWRRLSDTGTAAERFRVMLRGAQTPTSSNTADVLIWHPQIEDVTGQVNQNPSEYVSVGAPKLNYLIQSDDVTVSPWTTTNHTARAETPIICDGCILRASQIVATASTVKLQAVTNFPDTTLVYVIYAKKGSAATDLNSFVVYNGTTATNLATLTINYDTGVFTQTVGSGATAEDRGNGVWKITIPVTTGISAGNTLSFYAGCAGGSETAGEWAYFGGAQVVPGTTPPATYFPVGNVYPFHGSCVDGVKYFEYQNGNTVASNVVTETLGATLTACKGQLDETASANLVLQSSNFGTTWAAVGTPTRSAAAKYCGSIALDLIGDDDGAALEGYAQTITFTANADKSVSFLVAQGTSTSTAVRVRDTTAGADRLLGVVTWSGGAPTFTPTTGTQERAPQQLANGCWRIFAKAAGVVAANTNSLQVYPATDAALVTTATGNVYVGGVQAENATTASSHIPTTTGTVTRNADAGSYPAAGNVSASGGTLYLEYEIERDSSAAVDATLVDISDQTFAERVAVYRNSAGNLIAYVVDGVGQASLTLGSAPVGSRGKVAMRWAANDFAAVMTGGSLQTDASGTLPTVTRIQPGTAAAGVNQANGPAKNLRVSQQLLTNAELLALVA